MSFQPLRGVGVRSATQLLRAGRLWRREVGESDSFWRKKTPWVTSDPALIWNCLLTIPRGSLHFCVFMYFPDWSWEVNVLYFMNVTLQWRRRGEREFLYVPLLSSLQFMYSKVIWLSGANKHSFVQSLTLFYSLCYTTTAIKLYVTALSIEKSNVLAYLLLLPKLWQMPFESPCAYCPDSV